MSSPYVNRSDDPNELREYMKRVRVSGEKVWASVWRSESSV